MIEYINISECDEESLDSQYDGISKEAIEDFEARFEENRKKRIEKGLTAKPEEFVTNGK
jgi:hypothetical protein